jgi:hypothetical protein
MKQKPSAERKEGELLIVTGGTKPTVFHRLPQERDIGRVMRIVATGALYPTLEQLHITPPFLQIRGN